MGENEQGAISVELRRRGSKPGCGAWSAAKNGCPFRGLGFDCDNGGGTARRNDVIVCMPALGPEARSSSRLLVRVKATGPRPDP